MGNSRFWMAPGSQSTLNHAVHVLDPSETPENVLLDYLSDLGISTSSSAIESDNYAFLNPTGGAFTVNGDVEKVDDTHANVIYGVDGTPGAVVAGQSTAVITDFEPGFDGNGNPIEIPVLVNAAATNFLEASGDISRDSISGIQQLDVGGKHHPNERAVRPVRHHQGQRQPSRPPTAARSISTPPISTHQLRSILRPLIGAAPR